MNRYEKFESRVAPLPAENIDTDQIIPARFLKTTTKEGLSEKLFYDWRFDEQGKPRPEFVLNRPEYRDARILLAGDNFGCGSSREHAPWALTQFGFRAVISTSFADIFRQNALKNGLLPVTVPAAMHKEILEAVSSDPQLRLAVDLSRQALELPDGTSIIFPVDSFSKQCLLEGVDELGYLLNREPEISRFEASHPSPVNTLAGR